MANKHIYNVSFSVLYTDEPGYTVTEEDLKDSLKSEMKLLLGEYPLEIVVHKIDVGL